jgi:DHA1 family multidrug resistance protein-like MFS transporter
MASVFAGNTFFRSSFGGALPLAAPRMLTLLGIGWASSTLGLISLAMVPLPFILQRVSLLPSLYPAHINGLYTYFF